MALRLIRIGLVALALLTVGSYYASNSASNQQIVADGNHHGSPGGG